MIFIVENAERTYRMILSINHRKSKVENEDTRRTIRNDHDT